MIDDDLMHLHAASEPEVAVIDWCFEESRFCSCARSVSKPFKNNRRVNSTSACSKAILVRFGAGSGFTGSQGDKWSAGALAGLGQGSFRKVSKQSLVESQFWHMMDFFRIRCSPSAFPEHGVSKSFSELM